MTAPTPIPDEALEAAAKVALRRYESEYSVAPNVTWRDFVVEVRELVEAVAPILRADGVALAVSRIRALPADHHYERSMIVAERCARVAEGAQP